MYEKEMRDVRKTFKRCAGTALAAATALCLAATPAVAAQPVTSAFSDVEASGWYVSEVQWAFDNDVMHGYDNSDRFGVGCNLTRAEFAAVLMNHAGGSAASDRNVTGRPDLNRVDWYTAACNWAVSKGYIKGYDDGTFGPNDPVTREMALVILARYAGAGSGSSSELSSYPDGGSVSDWARGGVAWALEKSVISGSVQADGSRLIEPGRNVLREEIAKMLHGTVNVMGGAVNPSPSPSPDPDPTPSPDPDEPDPADPADPTPDPDAPATPVEPDPTPDPTPDPSDGQLADNDLGNGKYTMVWGGFTLFRLPNTPAGMVCTDSWSDKATDAVSMAHYFRLYKYNDDGVAKFAPQMIDKEVTYDSTTHRYHVTVTPRAGDDMYVGKLEYVSSEVPCRSQVYCMFARCSNCLSVVHDSQGREYATYLTNDSATSCKDLATNSPMQSNLAKYVTSAGIYGELDPHVEGKTVSEVMAEFDAVWGNSADEFPAIQAVAYNERGYILTAPWNLPTTMHCDECGRDVSTLVVPVIKATTNFSSVGH